MTAEAVIPSVRERVQDRGGRLEIQSIPGEITIGCESELCKSFTPGTEWVSVYNEISDEDDCMLNQENPLKRVGENRFSFNFRCS